MAKKVAEDSNGEPAGRQPTPEEFVQAWLSSQSTAEVARKLHMNVGAVRARCANYRKKGVRLRPLAQSGARGRGPLDVNALNALIDGTTP